MSLERRQHYLAVNEMFARAGLRVLAVATGAAAAATEESVRDLRLLGFAGLMDPPAAGVRDTIARLRRAGLRTVMLTGDQRLTAAAVGVELGLLGQDAEILDGRELESHGRRDARRARRQRRRVQSDQPPSTSWRS